MSWSKTVLTVLVEVNRSNIPVKFQGNGPMDKGGIEV